LFYEATSEYRVNVFIVDDTLYSREHSKKSEEEIIRIYGKRWGIEVFFKMCKSYLKLTGECRSMSYDAMTAYVAIVFARYVMLSSENRVRTNERTFGELFYEVCDELPDITWKKRSGF
jgi:hypothetical protein